jgi:hypothetical protein
VGFSQLTNTVQEIDNSPAERIAGNFLDILLACMASPIHFRHSPVGVLLVAKGDEEIVVFLLET